MFPGLLRAPSGRFLYLPHGQNRVVCSIIKNKHKSLLTKGLENQMPERIYYSQEAERMAKQQRLVSMLLFMAIGLGVGALIAILFAPDEGEKTRKLIAEAVEDGFKRGSESVTDALKDLEPEFPDLRKRVDGLLKSVKR